MFGKEKIATKELLKRIAALEVRCDDQERTARGLNLEFTDLYDKVSHQMSRMATRYAAAAKLNGPEPPEVPEPSHLDSLDPISKSIMLRRGGYQGRQ